VVMAGWVSSPYQWEKFCGRWQFVLNEYDAPYFHARELKDYYLKDHPESVFAKWTQNKRDRLAFESLKSQPQKPIDLQSPSHLGAQYD
jgi:hypothetical protein